MGKVVSAEVFLLHRKTIVLATAYGRPAQIRGHVIVKLTDENSTPEIYRRNAGICTVCT